MYSSWMMAAAGGLLLATACTTSDTVDLLADAGGGQVVSRPDVQSGAPDAGSFGHDLDPFGFDVPEFPGPDVGPGECGGVTGLICQDGQYCQFSGDCNVGSICNTSDDPYYDSSQPPNVCTRLVCARDQDCVGGRVCSVERVCVVPACQAASDCAPTDVCSGGTCVAAPTVGVSCEVLTPDTFVSPTRSVRLEARALDARGRVVGGLSYRWASSAPPRVGVVDDVATGGGELGVAEVTAVVLLGTSSVACAGQVVIENVTPVLSARVQVRVVAAESGAPVVGARVIVFVDGAQQELTTDGTGAAVFPPSVGDVGWVTVMSAGRSYLSVIAPGTRDLFLPLDRAPTPQLAGGFRGAVDVSSSIRGDMYVGLAGTALPLDLSGFRLSMLLGDPIDTTINAPQLGLNNQEMTLAGNLMVRLGNERFTVDRSTTNLRCQGLDPGPQELGCFVARAPAGRSAAWTLSTRLRLQDVASLAGRLSSGLEGGFDMVTILPDMMPLLRTAPSGVDADVITTEVARVDAVTGQASALCSNPSTAPDDTRCRADFARYASVPLRATAARRIHTAVQVPSLPVAGGQRPEAVLVFNAAVSPLGLVPLGLGGARDDVDAPDGLVEGEDKPFGPFSATLPDGRVALSSAVPHSGLEGLPLRLIAVAYDRALESGTGSRISGLVEPAATMAPDMGFGGRTFLAHPTGVIDRAAATFAGTTPSDATLLRIELVRGGSAWRIYAPPTTTTLTLPPVMEARVDLLAGGAAPQASIQAIRTRGSARHADVFTRGSGVSLGTVHAVTEAFAAQRCDEVATARCRVQ